MNEWMYSYHDDGTVIYDCADAVRFLTEVMARDNQRCGCFKGCIRNWKCAKHGWTCLDCGCCYKRNGKSPPLHEKIPSMDFANKFNEDVRWDTSKVLQNFNGAAPQTNITDKSCPNSQANSSSSPIHFNENDAPKRHHDKHSTDRHSGSEDFWFADIIK